MYWKKQPNFVRGFTLPSIDNFPGSHQRINTYISRWGQSIAAFITVLYWYGIYDLSCVRKHCNNSKTHVFWKSDQSTRYYCRVPLVASVFLRANTAHGCATYIKPKDVFPRSMPSPTTNSKQAVPCTRNLPALSRTIRDNAHPPTAHDHRGKLNTANIHQQTRKIDNRAQSIALVSSIRAWLMPSLVVDAGRK